MKSISWETKYKNGDITQHNESQKQKWVMFSFFGNETHFTKLFKGTNLHIAYRTKCTIQLLLKPKHSSIMENKFHYNEFIN